VEFFPRPARSSHHIFGGFSARQFRFRWGTPIQPEHFDNFSGRNAPSAQCVLGLSSFELGPDFGTQRKSSVRVHPVFFENLLDGFANEDFEVCGREIGDFHDVLPKWVHGLPFVPFLAGHLTPSRYCHRGFHQRMKKIRLCQGFDLWTGQGDFDDRAIGNVRSVFVRNPDLPTLNFSFKFKHHTSPLVGLLLFWQIVRGDRHQSPSISLTALSSDPLGPAMPCAPQ
jgi:hypothetical protein